MNNLLAAGDETLAGQLAGFVAGTSPSDAMGGSGALGAANFIASATAERVARLAAGGSSAGGGASGGPGGHGGGDRVGRGGDRL